MNPFSWVGDRRTPRLERSLPESALRIDRVDFETRAIHAGQEPDPATGAVTVPIYATSTFRQHAVGEHQGYEYSRTGNPTRRALETCLASLEGATSGFAFASGMAAAATVTELLDPGDRVLAVSDVYGGTYRLFTTVLAPKGYRFQTIECDRVESELTDHLDGSTRMLWLESPTNPLLGVVDIARAAEAAHAAGAMVVVDNTFATPYLQRPLELGADLVLHSTTKYLGGHSDVVGGFLATRTPELAERLAFLQNTLGAVAGPFDAWLVLRGLKTLAVRMRQHCANAREVVELLQGHPAVEQVLYPGLADHPGHAIAARQMADFGAMVSFRARSEAAALRIAAQTRVFTLAESLGGVESLIEHPGRMTHASTADSPHPVPGSLVRLSVGLESSRDLVSDLEAALADETR